MPSLACCFLFQWFRAYLYKMCLLKKPDAGKDWRQEKGTTEDEMVGSYHCLNRHEFEQTAGDGERKGSSVCCSPWVAKSQTWLSDWITTVSITQPVNYILTSSFDSWSLYCAPALVPKSTSLFFNFPIDSLVILVMPSHLLTPSV